MSSTLSGVSCVSTTACTAVGTITGPFFGETLTERWNGITWTMQTTPTSTNDGEAGSLSGVSCTSATACTAVGRYFINGTWATLAERWNGTSWTIQNTPNPSGAMRSSLMGVSCTSATACTAVGGYDDSFGTPLTLAERWNGTSWSIETTPNPTGTSGLTGVSCTSPTACTAVGIDEVAPATATFVTLGERWNGNTWTIQTIPQPSSAISSSLSGVSCTSATTCTAVGDYVNGIGTQVTLAERWNGTSWTIQTTPNTSGEQASTLSAVSCTSTTACTAVGEYVNSNGIPEALAEHYSS